MQFKKLFLIYIFSFILIIASTSLSFAQTPEPTRIPQTSPTNSPTAINTITPTSTSSDLDNYLSTHPIDIDAAYEKYERRQNAEALARFISCLVCSGVIAGLIFFGYLWGKNSSKSKGEQK